MSAERTSLIDSRFPLMTQSRHIGEVVSTGPSAANVGFLQLLLTPSRRKVRLIRPLLN
jgi:hypothetical protein